jgi:hypothetical protein
MLALTRPFLAKKVIDHWRVLAVHFWHAAEMLHHMTNSCDKNRLWSHPDPANRCWDRSRNQLGALMKTALFLILAAAMVWISSSQAQQPAHQAAASSQVGH